MSRSYPVLLGFLAAMWGGSYLFIKVAVEEIEPAPMNFVRLAVAAALLVGFLVWRMGRADAVAELRGSWRPGLVLGLTSAALPFTLIAWGEKYIDSGVAAIANATVPIFVVLLAIRFKPSERASRTRLVGILVGIVGVAVLTGGQSDVGGWQVAGVLAVVVASISFAGGSLYGQLCVEGTTGPVLATASMIGGATLMLPSLLLWLPTELPSWETIASLVALTMGGTAVAQLVLFQMLRLHGALCVSLVTYLTPPIALFYGAMLLAEAITAASLAGLALILLGVALGSGGVRFPRRDDFPAAPHG